MGSLSSGAMVVNANFDVLMWNHKAEDMWGLRADEALGKSLFSLDIGLPVAQLRDVIRPCLVGDTERREVVLDAVNRRGKKIRCRVACAPLVNPGNRREGAIALMEEVP
jgi:two-component system CheB/CheR fusion protein